MTRKDRRANYATDSGWAWMILLSSFMTMMLWDGTIKSLAVLLPTLQQQFATRTWMIGGMIALMNAVKDFSGPIIGACTDLVDTRYLGVAGGILSGFGMIAASFATRIEVLILCVSILNGVGVGLLLIPSLALLGRYFDRLYPFASGVAYAGISLGMVVFAPLTQMLLESYGWRGTVMLLGAICCHGIVAGSLLRPSQFDSDGEKLNIGKNVLNSYDALEEECGGYHEEAENESFGWRSEKCLPPRWQQVLELTGISLFKNTSFVAAIFMMSCDSFSKTGWIVYFIPHCIVKGLTPYEAAFSATAAGTANLIGRLIYIPFVSKNLISVPTILYLSGILTAFALMVDPWTNSLTTILIANILYCLGAGVLKPLCDVHIKTIAKERLLSQAFGLRMAMNGVFRILAGYLVGWIYESTGSYSGGF
ncbi:monocarboxylate transporter 13-like [Amphiura filiformis]|uniref:monocarboxylate transporter 13-like n=1 Tax=Amphiura filiformis TaxID=82378 RepID=UPI003B20EC6A